jgi:hypothetical protein
MPSFKFFFLASIAALLTGCVTAPPATLPKLVHVANITDQITEKTIGQLYIGTVCHGEIKLIWNNNPRAIPPMQQNIIKTLEQGGYKVYSGLIQSRGQNEADIVIGVGITDVKANICSSVRGAKGEVAMTLSWEIYETATKKTLNLLTSGTAVAAEFSESGDPDIYIAAALMATNNLLANKEFYQLTRK